MNKLTTFTFFAETTLGSIALGTLWLSSWPLLIKIAFSCALILLCISQDLASLQRSLQSEQALDFLDLGIRSLEQRLGGFKSEVQHLQPCKVSRCKAPRDITSNFSLKTA